VSFLGRPLGLDFRPSVGGAIIRGAYGEKYEVSRLKIYF